MRPDFTPDAVGQPAANNEQPAPAERAKRKRIPHPVFSTRLFRPGARMALTGMVLAAGLGLHAQTVPTPATGRTDRAPVDPPARTWVPFDDAMARELQIPPEQLQQLRAVDERFMTDYRALGTNPARDPRYPALTERRNAEVRQLMSEAMFNTWTAKYQPVPNTIQDQREGGISTPPPPTP